VLRLRVYDEELLLRHADRGWWDGVADGDVPVERLWPDLVLGCAGHRQPHAGGVQRVSFDRVHERRALLASPEYQYY